LSASTAGKNGFAPLGDGNIFGLRENGALVLRGLLSLVFIRDALLVLMMGGTWGHLGWFQLIFCLGEIVGGILLLPVWTVGRIE